LIINVHTVLIHPHEIYLEWLNGPFNQTSSPYSKRAKDLTYRWTLLWSIVSDPDLKRARRVPTLHTGRSQKTIREMPPAFQIKSLGFRIVLDQPQGHSCTSLP
jgi:hypothetical protein